MREEAEGVIRSVTREGERTFTAFRRLRNGWYIGVATPSAPSDKAFARYLGLFGGAWLGILLLGLVLTRFLTDRINRNVAATVSTATRLAAGEPAEFMSPFGMRSLSRCHAQEPFRFGEKVVCYEPAEAESKIKGGNSNWRGPVWFPTTFLMIESLRKLGTAYGPTLQVPADGHDGPPRGLWDLAEDIANRMIRIFTRDENGRRAVYASRAKFQDDPHWRDLILFHEYFHGETGEGLGASHQTGWTGLIAKLLQPRRREGEQPEPKGI